MTDIEAYAAAQSLFSSVKRARELLPTLLEEYNGHFLLHSGMADVIGKTTPGDRQDALICNLAEHEQILGDIVEQYGILVKNTHDARIVISAMGDPGDALILELYYMLGLSERQIPTYSVDGKKVWHYSPDYVHEKKEIALTNAGYIMRDLELVLKYA